MARYIQAEEDVTTLGNPPTGSQALVFDNADHQLKRKLPDGTLVSIEGGIEIPSGATFPTTGYEAGDFYFNTTLGVLGRHNGGTAGDDTDWDYVDLSTISGTLPIAHGGTGATTAPDALTALGAAPTTHATEHRHGGGDEVGVETPAANAIPKAGADGTLDTWVSDATTTAKGKVELATDGEAAAGVAVQGNDSRLSDARTPTTHADTHHTGGADALAPADIGAAAATHAHDGTDITTGTVGSARLPSASNTTAGIVPTTSGSATGDKLRVKADGELEWYTPPLDEAKVSKLYESDGGSAAVEVDAAGAVNLSTDIILPDNSSFLLRTTYATETPALHFSTTTLPTGWYWATNNGFDGTPPELSVMNNTWLNVPGTGDYYLALDITLVNNHIDIIARIARAVSNNYIGLRIDNGSNTTAATEFIESKLVAGTTGYKLTREDSSGTPRNSVDNITPRPILIYCGKWGYTMLSRARYVLDDCPVEYTIDDSNLDFFPTRIGLIFSSGYSLTGTSNYTMVDWFNYEDLI